MTTNKVVEVKLVFIQLGTTTTLLLFKNFVSPAVWWWWWWLALALTCSAVTAGVLDGCFDFVFVAAASPGVMANSIRRSSSVRQLLMSVISSPALMALEERKNYVFKFICNGAASLWILIFLRRSPFIILTLTNDPTCVVCVRGVHDERALPDQSTV